MHSHEGPRPPGPVSLHYFLVLIRQQREWQFVFLHEFVVRLGFVRAYAQNDRPFLLEFFPVIPKRTGFPGATGCIIPGEKIENHILAPIIRQRNPPTAIRFRRERWSDVAFL